MRSQVHVLGGGTVYHVRPQFALCSPSYGQTAVRVGKLCQMAWEGESDVHVHLTRMASGGRSDLETNDDVETLLKSVVDDPATRVVFMAASLCDFRGHVLDRAITTESGLFLPKFRKPDGRKVMIMDPASELVSEIRKYRKDIFLIGFKTTSGATEDEVFSAGISMADDSSCNLVLASDFVTKVGMIVSPEKERICVTKDRNLLLSELVQETKERSSRSVSREEIV